MKKSLKQWLSALLAITMIVGMLVVPATAADQTGAVGNVWSFGSSNAAFHAGNDAASGGAENGTYGADRKVDGDKEIGFDGLLLSVGTGAYNKDYCFVADNGGYIKVPVTGQCNVAVTCAYGCAGTVGVDGNTVTLKNETVEFPYDGTGSDNGYVTIAHDSTTTALYVTKIEI